MSIRDKNIICISSIDWDSAWQVHQELNVRFARMGNRVLYIENTGSRMPRVGEIGRLWEKIKNRLRTIKGFKKIDANLFLFTPLVIPFPYLGIVRFINRLLIMGSIKRWVRQMHFHNSLVWTYLPTGTTLDIIRELDPEVVVYYCIADFAEFKHHPRLITFEDRLLERADIVFAQGEEIKQRCERIAKNVSVYPAGVTMEAFKRPRPSETAKQIRALKGRIIGYIGTVNKYIDLTLLAKLAQKGKDRQVVLVGPNQVDLSALEKLENFHYFPGVPHAEIPAVIGSFDLCLIPYILDSYTKTVYPTKMLEYLAAGKTALSYHLPEVEKFSRENENCITVVKDRRAFITQAEKMLKRRPSPAEQKKYKAIAGKNSWPSRVEAMCRRINAVSNQKQESNDLHWKKRLTNYRNLLLRVAAVTAAALFVLFATPLIWYVGAPLSLADPIKKSDAIVVFGGGYGQGGINGMGYAERIRYAIKLYKQKLAPMLVISSGDILVYRETKLMRAIARSEGVPERAIILEGSYGGTYQKATGVLAIARRRGFQRLIVISAPYHMRRMDLIFNRHRSDVRVIKAPFSETEFYKHSRKKPFFVFARPDQWRGILHEYAAIVYYWWKGWI